MKGFAATRGQPAVARQWTTLINNCLDFVVSMWIRGASGSAADPVGVCAGDYRYRVAELRGIDRIPLPVDLLATAASEGLLSI